MMNSWIRRGLAALLVSLAAAACSSGTSTPTKLSTIGDDCAMDSDCASGLCDNMLSCAAPVATLDGKKCTTDADGTTGDHCHTATGQCFSNAKDGTGMHACTTTADCPGDETCVKGLCAG